MNSATWSNTRKKKRRFRYLLDIADPLSIIAKYAKAKLLGRVVVSFPLQFLLSFHPAVLKYADTKGSAWAK